MKDVANGKANLAWELYLKMETSGEYFNLLQIIGNDCYKVNHFLHLFGGLLPYVNDTDNACCFHFGMQQKGQFLYAAKAFDVLERLDPEPSFFEAKIGACIAVFQSVVANREPKETLHEIIGLLRQGDQGGDQVEDIIRIIRRWGKENRFII